MFKKLQEKYLKDGNGYRIFKDNIAKCNRLPNDKNTLNQEIHNGIRKDFEKEIENELEDIQKN